MKDEEAGRKALVQLRNTEDVSEELNEIKAEDSSESNNNSGSISVFHLLTLSKFRLALLVTICVHLSHQLSGMPAILYYSTKFFMVSELNQITKSLLALKTKDIILSRFFRTQNI